MNLRQSATAILLSVVALSMAAPVLADPITLEAGHPGDPQSSQLIPLPYMEAGYSINAAGGLYYLGSLDARYAGGSNMFNATYNDVTTLTRVDSTAFNMNSIKLAMMWGSAMPSEEVMTFTGFKSGGGTVTQTFNVSNATFETYLFDDAFTDLSSVTWGTNVSEFTTQFGEIDVSHRRAQAPQTSAVPESASWALMMIGFGALGVSMRRRQKAAVNFS